MSDARISELVQEEVAAYWSKQKYRRPDEVSEAVAA